MSPTLTEAPSDPKPASPGEPAKRPRAPRSPALLSLAPLLIVVALFFLLPIAGMALLAFTVEQGDGSESFGLANFADLSSQKSAIANSVLVSSVGSIIGALVGALTAFCIAGIKSERLETIAGVLSSVLASDGGAPLAFSFIAALGNTGVVFVALHLGEIGFTLYSWQGLVVMYQYFLIPTMVIVTLPTFVGLRQQWREANTALGGTAWTFWRRVGLPIVSPALLGGWILLFGAAFATYASAAVLIGSGAFALIPLAIASGLSSGNQAGGEASAMALGVSMVVVAVLVLLLFNRLQRISLRRMQ